MIHPDQPSGRRSIRTAALTLPAVAVLAFPLLPGAVPAQEAQEAQEAPSSARGGDPNTTERAEDVVFAIHGGAGTLDPDDMSPELERRYREALTRAVRTGYRVVQEGGESTQAVEKAVNAMEDSPLFNAGKGAVFNTDAANELDASIMDGESLDAGAVTGTQHVKNPISLSKEIMENSKHLMLTGEGAERYAQHRGVDLVTQDYFFTERRWDALRDAKDGKPDFEWGETNTVGAVGIDDDGNVAAGTSTGGLTDKPVGRVGDSPVIGAGTYADDDTMAASATGTGELFMRQAVTHDISAQLEYTDRRVHQAAGKAIDKTEQIGGPDSGGVIALDRDRNLAFVFNTTGMYRAYATADGDVVVRIFDDE